MSKRWQQAMAFAVALLLIIISWEQIMKWKGPVARLKYVLLTPLPVALGATDLLAVLLFLIQWPMLALVFCLGLRRWKPSIALAVVAAIYILLAITAFVLIGRA
jgi:hypothetical protein